MNERAITVERDTTATARVIRDGTTIGTLTLRDQLRSDAWKPSSV